MRRQRQAHTEPELAVRRELFRRGLRYRVNYSFSGTRVKADIVFPSVRIAVFIDGCFWHSCPIHATEPTRNREWWRRKLAANVARDAKANDLLRTAGWEVLRFWEHEDPAFVAAEVAQRVAAKRNDPG